jgi:SAM-dependent methyltransferase
MPSPAEVKRLQTVYRGYARDSRAKWSPANPGNRLMWQERAQLMVRLLKTNGCWSPGAWRILEVGCGSGHVLADCARWGIAPAQLYGVDLLPTRLQTARCQFPHLAFQWGNAEHLSFKSATFDLVFTFTIFSSILAETMTHNIAAEINRVLKPGGAVLWYDVRYNNPRNPHVRGLSRAAIQALFPGFTPHLQTVTLLPPLARRLGPATSALYPLLSRLPWLRTHYLGLLVKPARTG